MPESIRIFLNSTTKRLASLGRPSRLLAISLGVLVVISLSFWVIDKIFVFFVARSYVDEIAFVFDLNKHLATAIALIAFAAIIISTRYIFSFSKTYRRIGLLAVLSLLVGHALILWWGTSTEIIDRRGTSVKCYVITRDGVIFGNRPGVDPNTGQECKEVRPELVEKLRAYERGRRPTRIEEIIRYFSIQEPVDLLFGFTNREVEQSNFLI